MGMISNILGAFGSGQVRETIEVFRPNAEASDARGHDRYLAALAQLSAERAAGGWFGGLVDGLNRLPRPAMAFGTIGLFVFAMADPASFSVRITALALIPDQLWWLLGAIVTFYFGAREIAKTREGHVTRTMEALAEWRAGTAATRGALADRDPAPAVASPALEVAAPVAPAVVSAPVAIDHPDDGPPPGANLIDFAVLSENPALAEARQNVK